MADSLADLGMLRTADGRPLQSALARSQRRAQWRALFLVLPLLVFVLLTFVMPIGTMLYRSVNNPAFLNNMPATVAWFAANPVGTGPDELAYAALVTDLQAGAVAKTVGIVAARINYDVSGTRSLFTSAARKVKGLEPPFKQAMIDLNEDWGSPEVWAAMRAASAKHSTQFYLAAVDMKTDLNGKAERVPENQRIYVKLFWKTLWLSAVIAGICLIIGFPVAHLLATLPMRYSNLLMILVLLPFWTSLLVRTTSWIALLQSKGIVNDLLVWLGIISEAGRVQMMYNQTGTIVAMTHILLPFMILPLYSVMRTIRPTYVRAARSLGATSWTAFRRVYLPQTVPGIGAGALLVFILAVGYYITPALVGGSTGVLISNQIAYHMTDSLNWSMAAALAALLLAGVLLLYWLYDRIIGIDNMKLG